MQLPDICRRMRRNILDMAFNSKTAHIGPSLCIVEILAVLYFRIMNIDPQDPEAPDRDRFLLSKGHAAAALYTTLALRGYFPEEELTKYCVDGGRFHGHPCRDAAPGIEFSSGSLGHGLSVAAGMALSLKGISKGVIFTLLGDGECNEGSVWEAATFAAKNRLNNLVAIIDVNRFQGFAATEDIDSLDLKKKWEAFGWTAFEVDGHDFVALEQVLNMAKQLDCPVVILANTISGKGIKAIENTLLAHYFVLDETVYQQTLREIYAE